MGVLANCESVCESWRQFVINNGVKLWKRQYLQKLAKPGTDAHHLIKSNPKLFQYDQVDHGQGTFHIFTRVGMTCNAGLSFALLLLLLLLLGQICSEYCIFYQFQPTMPVCTTLNSPFLFADYEEMSRHFRYLYFKVCQIPFATHQNDHQTTVVKFIRDYANDNPPTDYYGRTPLDTAAQYGDQLTVLLILQYAKDKNPAAKNGKTPLHLAVKCRHLKTVKLLLEHAVDKNPADNDGWTPLHSAAEEGHLETVKLLLEHAKYKNPACNDGTTPLHIAAYFGHLETVKLLLEHAKDKHPADNGGETPIHLAAHVGHVEIVKLIEEFKKKL
jgi:hypothetical protein